MITSEVFTRTLADQTRLRILMLLLHEEELCVCHLTNIMQMVQPKISRHLAVLRENKLLLDRRNGLWIHYRLHPNLPMWCYQTLQSLSKGCLSNEPFINDRKELEKLDIHSEQKTTRNLNVVR